MVLRGTGWGLKGVDCFLLVGPWSAMPRYAIESECRKRCKFAEKRRTYKIDTRCRTAGLHHRRSNLDGAEEDRLNEWLI